MTLASALYAGTVVHQRMKPKKHRLQYRVFSLLLDLDELSALDRRLRLFGHNRRAVFSFRDSDHGDGAEDLRGWVDRRLAEAGIAIPGGRVQVLCYPRLFGYVFNPLSVFYCFEAGGALVAMLYEVSNTFGEKHTYVIPSEANGGKVVRQRCRKTFFVSPFVEMDCTYNFRVSIPGDRTAVSIVEHDREGVLLSAVFSGARKTLDDRTLAWALFTYPLMTVKVMAGIHVEALRLWLKGVPFIRHRRRKRAITSSVIDAHTHSTRLVTRT